MTSGGVSSSFARWYPPAPKCRPEQWPRPDWLIYDSKVLTFSELLDNWWILTQSPRMLVGTHGSGVLSLRRGTPEACVPATPAEFESLCPSPAPIALAHPPESDRRPPRHTREPHRENQLRQSRL